MALPPIIIFKDNLDSITGDMLPYIVHMLHAFGYNNLCLEYQKSSKEDLSSLLIAQCNHLEKIIAPVKNNFLGLELANNTSFINLKNLLTQYKFPEKDSIDLAANFVLYNNTRKIIHNILPTDINVNGIDMQESFDFLNNCNNVKIRTQHMHENFQQISNSNNSILILGNIHLQPMLNLLHEKQITHNYLIINLSSIVAVNRAINFADPTIKNIFMQQDIYPLRTLSEITSTLIYFLKNHSQNFLEQELIAKFNNFTLCTPQPLLHWQYNKMALPIGIYPLLKIKPRPN